MYNQVSSVLVELQIFHLVSSTNLKKIVRVMKDLRVCSEKRFVIICKMIQIQILPCFFFILVCQNDPNDPVYCRFILKIVIGPTTGDAGVLINFYYFSTFPGSCVLKVSVVTFPLRQYSSYLVCSQLRYS